MNRRQMTWGVVAVAAVAGVMWWLRPTPHDVDVAVLAEEVLRVTIDEPGVTRLPDHAEVSTPSPGRLEDITLDVGDAVRAGQVVATLHPAPLDGRALDEARAQVRAAQAMREEAEAMLRQGETALAEAQRERARVARLAEAGAVAPRALEDAQTAESVQARGVEAARARLRAATEGERRAVIAARTGPLAGVVTLRSPIAGSVLRRFQEHDRVLPAGTPVLEVGDPTRLEVVLEVLSREAVGLSAGLPVLYQLPGGDSARGRVHRVEPAAFTKVSALGIAEQRVRVVTRPDAPMPGVGDAFELPTAIVTWEGKDVLAVPAGALVPIGEGWGVYRVLGGKAHRLPITVGHRGARALEVTTGLSPGDTVILLPDERIGDGVRVRPAR
jgi:HlyD family secretion protein